MEPTNEPSFNMTVQGSLDGGSFTKPKQIIKLTIRSSCGQWTRYISAGYAYVHEIWAYIEEHHKMPTETIESPACGGMCCDSGWKWKPAPVKPETMPSLPHVSTAVDLDAAFASKSVSATEYCILKALQDAPRLLNRR